MLPVDASGEARAEPNQLYTDLNLPDPWVFPSPDGRKLVLLDIRHEGILDYVFDTEIGDIKDLPVSLILDMFFNWFPDSQRVLIRVNDRSLVLVDSKTGEYTRISTSMYDTVDSAAASPDGNKIIYSLSRGFSGPTQMWIVNSNGRDAQLLIEYPVYILELSWSPDVKKIVFLGDGLMAMDADDSNLINLGNPDIALCSPLKYTWSPDSRWLAMVVSKSAKAFCTGWNDDVFDQTDIFLIYLENGRTYPLLSDGIKGNIDPAWSPDGTQFAFVSNRSGASELWVVNVDGTNLRQLTDYGEYVRFPFWSRP